MRIYFQRSHRDDVPGAVVVEREAGRRPELIECMPADAARVLAEVRTRYGEISQVEQANPDNPPLGYELDED